MRLLTLLGIRIIIAIIRAISNNGYSSSRTDESPLVKYTPDPTPPIYSEDYSQNDFEYIEESYDNKSMDVDVLEEKTYLDRPFICPECFEPYDGFYCDSCGYSNDEVDT